jgi:hypothetical protein
MINYLPERIYNAVKDDTDYNTIITYVENKKATCTTLEEFVDSDSDEFLGSVQTNQYRTMMENIITKYCPLYLDEYKINNGEYTKDQLIAMYEDTTNKYDIETKFFILSNIINNSYLDRTYESYMGLFVTYYESITDDTIKKNLAKYVHLKYMYAKSHLLSLELDMTKSNWQTNLGNQLYSLYTSILSITGDYDITKNYALEALAYSI